MLDFFTVCGASGEQALKPTAEVASLCGTLTHTQIKLYQHIATLVFQDCKSFTWVAGLQISKLSH
jgi:hypothetical protein